MVSGLTLHDIEGMQSDIAAGKSLRAAETAGAGEQPVAPASRAIRSEPCEAFSVMPPA
jgi:hypothetical protein